MSGAATLEEGVLRQRLVGAWILVLLLALGGVAADGSAQASDVHGRVVAGDSSGPLAEVAVRVTGPAERVAITGGTGRFAFFDLPSGLYTFEFLRLGFEDVKDTVTVSAGRATQLTISMGIAPVEVRAIEVQVRPRGAALRISRVYERMERGLGGEFLTREDLEEMGSVPLGQAIDRLPRTKVKKLYGPYYDLRFGRCEPTIVLNGHVEYRPNSALLGTNNPPPEPSEALSIPTSAIEAVEVYDNPAIIPSELIFGDARCLVAIWTRR